MLSKFWPILKQAFIEWRSDKAPQLGAALAYYTLFSLAPLLVISIAVAGWWFGDDAARGELSRQLQGLLGRQGAEAVEVLVESAGRQKASGVLATVIGVVALLFGASGVFTQLKDALNTIWDVPPRESGGVFALIAGQFLSFAMVLSIGFLLIVSLLASSILAAASGWLDRVMPVPTVVIETAHGLLSLILFTTFFAAIFKILPDTYVAWSDVWVGALGTSVLFWLGKFLIGLYLGHSAVASTYGAAGSLVVVLIWTYYSAQILLYGAEFTQAYACRHGSRSACAEPAASVQAGI